VTTFDDVEKARLDLEKAYGAMPPDGRLLADDITPEAMVQRMAAQGERLAIFAPEPGPLQVLAGRYDRGKGARLGELNRAWSAEELLVDRVHRERLRVTRPALTVAICLQPGVLDQMSNADAFKVEGTLARFLWVQPPHG